MRTAAVTSSTFCDSNVVFWPRRIARVRNLTSRSSSIVPMRASSAPNARRWQTRAHWSIASLSLMAIASSFSSMEMRVRAALPLATSAWHRTRSASAMGL